MKTAEIHGYIGRITYCTTPEEGRKIIYPEIKISLSEVMKELDEGYATTRLGTKLSLKKYAVVLDLGSIQDIDVRREVAEFIGQSIQIRGAEFPSILKIFDPPTKSPDVFKDQKMVLLTGPSAFNYIKHFGRSINDKVRTAEEIREIQELNKKPGCSILGGMLVGMVKYFIGK